MIIKNQNKKAIYNFEQMKGLSVEEQTNLSKANTFKIVAHFSSDIAKLAEYETEERAMEVLEEINKIYTHNKALELYAQLGNVTEANRQGYSLTPVYEMPEK